VIEKITKSNELNDPKMKLKVIEKDKTLVVDSRLVADSLGVEHISWMNNVVYKHQPTIEQHFGSLHFQNEVKKRAKGATTIKYCYLTEDQSIFLMTLSRNTPQVIDCKANLVKAFSEAKKRLEKLPKYWMLASLLEDVENPELHPSSRQAMISAIKSTLSQAIPELKPALTNSYLTSQGFSNFGAIPSILKLYLEKQEVELIKKNQQLSKCGEQPQPLRVSAREVNRFLKDKQRRGELDRNITPTHIANCMAVIGWAMTVDEFNSSVWVRTDFV
jgi:phage regulator Rha-like protein